MKAENTNAVMGFIFKGMVLAHEACRVLYTPEDKVVKKPNNTASPQYLKVLKPILWDQRLSLLGVPYDVRPIRNNTLMVDDNASKNI